MLWKRLTLIAAISISVLSTVSPASAGHIADMCAGLHGGDRRCPGFKQCVALMKQQKQGVKKESQNQSEKPKLLRVDPENRFGNAAIRRKLQPVALGAPHFDPGPVSVNKKDKNAKESQGLAPIDMNTVIPGSAPRGP